MDYKKHIRLLNKLTERTAAGSVQWEATAEDNSFQTSISGIIVRISEEKPSDPSDQEPDYCLGLYNVRGERVETFGYQELISPGVDFNPYTAMKNLYQDALRNAMGADKAIDDVIKGLDDMLPF